MAAPRYLPLCLRTWRLLITRWHAPITKLVREEYLISPARSLSAAFQAALIACVPAVKQSPIFVLGFWRSGTTLLHELLSTDDRFCYPSTYDCLNAHHFVLTSMFARFRSREIVRRPQDGMTMGWSTPQEDEFALLALGARSPYEGLLVPQAYEKALALADPDELNPNERSQWVRVFMRILRGLSLINRGRPILLKSPAHGYRVQVIRRLIPEAKFIVIVRNPHEVLESWVKTYRSFTQRYGLGPRLPDDRIREITLRERLRYEAKLQRGLEGIRGDQLIYVKYEDLIADPTKTIQLIYYKLGLPDFEHTRGLLGAELEKRAGYSRRASMPDEIWRKRAERMWRSLFDRYGYDLEHPSEAEENDFRTHIEDLPEENDAALT